MKQQTEPTETINVQKRCGEIHAQYCTSEMANYRIQQMCDKIAQDAFNEGKQSVIDNVPDLEWKRENKDKYVSHTPFFNYTIELFNGSWEIRIIGLFSITDTLFATLYEAKLFAEEDYKNRIKQALGL